MNDELLDIVNKNDEIINQKLRSEIYLQKLSNFRVVNAFLINKAGKLWIPRRTKKKQLFPLCLDASMGGHVRSGETYEEALKRELLEELRIDIKNFSHKYLGTLNPYNDKTSAFMKVYLLYSDKIPNYNKNDFIEYFWLSPKELLTIIASGEKCKSDLPLIVKSLL